MQANGSTIGVIATGTSVGAASWTWLVNTNEILQLIATAVAIVSGIYAIRYWRKRDAAKKDSET